MASTVPNAGPDRSFVQAVVVRLDDSYQVKIDSLTTRMVDLPLARPVGTAIHAMRSVGCVLVEAQCDNGVVGQSYIFSLNAKRIRSLDEMVKGYAEFVVGRSPAEHAEIFDAIWKAINPMGHAGVTIAGLSAIDVALWDAIGKDAGLPLHQLWGSDHKSVAAYATSGLWLSETIDELLEDAQAFVNEGFTGIKIRLGSANPADDVERVRAVRNAIGPDIELYSDVNQGLNVEQAITLGQSLAEFNLTWFEEPVPYYDEAGHAAVRAAVDVPIATGESVYTRIGMQRLIDAGAADVLMPDLQRIGGFSEFRRASEAAGAAGVPVSSHFFTEQSLCLAASIDNCISVEHCDWFSPLFNEPMEMVNGEVLVPNRPGHGFTFNEDIIAAHPLRD